MSGQACNLPQQPRRLRYHRLDDEVLSVPVEWHAQLGSTNSEAQRLIHSGQARACWIIAEQQTSGRGRAGRKWASPIGNFCGTRLHPLGQDLSVYSGLSLAVGLCVQASLAQALRPQGANELRCKWPNDVLLDGAKISGILIETAKAHDGTYWANIGIGVNLAHAPDVEGRATTSLAAHGGDITVSDFLSQLDARLTTSLEDWSRFGAAGALKNWSDFAFGMNTDVKLTGGARGTFIGVDAQGAARVRLDSGAETVVHAGDLTFSSLEA